MRVMMLDQSGESMTTTFSFSLSADRLLRTLGEICSLGSRWQGSEGERKVLTYLEGVLLRRIGISCKKEAFEYLGFNAQMADLVLEGPPSTKVDCQSLAYSGSKPVAGELIYIPGENLSESAAAKGKIVLTDALKSYQAYPQAVRGGAAGFVFGNHLKENLIRAGVTNYEGCLGSIPAVAIGSENTRLLTERARTKSRIRMEVRAESKWQRSENIVVNVGGNRQGARILVCSHYDSMALGPHAFDNASGTAAILELIEIFKGFPYPLTFLLCGAEELGFWGSKAFVRQHLEECKRLDAVVCLDGISSDLGSVEIGVTESLAPRIRHLAEREALEVDQWSIPPRPSSDHTGFEALGIPVFWLTSMDPYYHTAMDVPEHVGKEKLTRHTTFAAHVVANLAVP
jgi:Zn-dependent M28 family amino/carboxypeptidase